MAFTAKPRGEAPQGWDPQTLHALDLMEAKEWEKARQELQLVLGGCSRDNRNHLSELYLLLGRCHLAIGDTNAARDALGLAVSVNHENTRAVNALWELEEKLEFTRT